jgi:hypothetical protein
MATPEQPDDPLLQRPAGITLDDPLTPRSPWSFWKDSLRGGFGYWGLQLISGWLAFQLMSSTVWAFHLKGYTGFGSLQSGGSGLPRHWGELLTARDLWELFENGGMKNDLLGTATPALAALGLVWILWAGWRLQAASAGVPGSLSPWLLGLLDSLIIGVLPLTLVAWPVLWALGRLGTMGFATLGWVNLVGGAILRLSVVSAILLQWWLCRLNRAAALEGGFLLGSWRAWRRHLRESFLRLWLHPIHWSSLLLAGTTLRLGLPWLALWIGWRLGGGSSGRVWLFLLMQLLATAAGAWLLGWLLRLVGLFWAQDRRVRNAKAELESQLESDHAATAAN